MEKTNHIRIYVKSFGKTLIESFEFLGSFLVFFKDAIWELGQKPYRVKETFQQAYFIGNQSFFIILMSAFAIGSVFGIQVGIIFRIFSAEGQIGVATAMALTRELAPMLTAFLVAGRAGSAITAEIATMRINEQIDAIEVMGVRPLNYLVTPRLLACFLMVPLLAAIFVLVGIGGSFVVSSVLFEVDPGYFFAKITQELSIQDVLMTIEKAFLFGSIIAVVSCRYGLYASGGARGVGKATTQSVITSLLTILLVDFLYTFLDIAI